MAEALKQTRKRDHLASIEKEHYKTQARNTKATAIANFLLSDPALTVIPHDTLVSYLRIAPKDVRDKIAAEIGRAHV